MTTNNQRESDVYGISDEIIEQTKPARVMKQSTKDRLRDQLAMSASVEIVLRADIERLEGVVDRLHWQAAKLRKLLLLLGCIAFTACAVAVGLAGALVTVLTP